MSDFDRDVNQKQEDEIPAPTVQIQQGSLYLRLPSEQDPRYGKVRAMVNMFPGDSSLTVFFADTRQRRGSRCSLDNRLLRELEALLGTENVVVK